MKVWHFGGEAECKTIEELDSIMNLRYGTGVNEFLICGDKKYPYLAVLVKNNYAFLSFFPEDEEFIYQSKGMYTSLDPNEMSTFYTGTPTVEIEVWNEFVVPFDKAKEAAIEFFSSLALPVCIDWSEQ
jgi:hypothetical protein